MDRSDRGSDSEVSINKSSDSGPSGESKSCADCGTTKTPLWRGGPAGPKSLCNACGIRSRKKRRGLVGLNKSSADKKKSKSRSLKGKETMSPVRNAAAAAVKRWTMDNLRRKLGEEEQAAVVLIALSFASVY
ncbi:GATA transcription factor 15-like [Impatiens glandulifera]|uniref:GATA transcription factor 15-like n=1 Tax=Impatiens glandulifera TaxID=253017 RepID=UPI001FB0A4B6|nr:GATA transcription factor 15-like [Impatiens glandulifera]